jgi:hypothetical protein
VAHRAVRKSVKIPSPPRAGAVFSIFGRLLPLFFKVAYAFVDETKTVGCSNLRMHAQLPIGLRAWPSDLTKIHGYGDIGVWLSSRGYLLDLFNDELFSHYNRSRPSRLGLETIRRKRSWSSSVRTRSCPAAYGLGPSSAASWLARWHPVCVALRNFHGWPSCTTSPHP